MNHHFLSQSMQVSFYFKYSQTKSLKELGYGTIYYYVMLNSKKSVEQSSKIQCNVSQWDANSKKLIGLDVERDNKRLSQIKQVIEKNKDIFEILGEPITANELVKMTTVSVRHKKTFLDVFQEYKAEQFLKIRKEEELKSKSNIERTTYVTYLKRENNIVKYLKSINKSQVLCADIDARFCEMLDNYLTQNGCGQAYSTKNVKLVQSVMIYAKNAKIISVNFSESYKSKSIPRKPVNTLRMTDIEKLELSTHLFTSTEQKYVDVFLFLHEIIMHVGDYRQLTSKNFETYPNGQIWLRKPRKKRQEENNQIQILPLSQKAIDIMKKYRGIDNMPKTTGQTMSKYVKMACVKAGIEKNVSLKMGRSSGISYKYNKLKMREHSIAIAAGWTSTAHLKDYLDIDYDDFYNEFMGDKV